MHVVSKTWLITLVSWLLSLLALAMTIVLTMVSSSSKTTTLEFSDSFGWLVTASLVLMAAVDYINTIALCFYLRIEKTGSQKCVE